LVTGTAVTTPHVKVFNGSTGSEIYSFFAYAAGFAGGVRVASGDINGDGRADIVTGAGPGGSGHVKVFDGANLTEIRSFLAYGPSFPAGVFVAAGDVNGDGKADIVTGADSGAAAHVKVFDGVTLAQLQSFFAYAPPFVGGVRVAAGDMNGDGRAEILTTPGGGGAPYVRVFDGLTLAETAGFYAYAVSFTNGVFISAASVQRPRLEISPTRSPQEVQLRWPSGCVCQLEASIDPSNPQGWTVQDVQPTENGTRLGLLLPAVQKIQVFRLKCDDEAVR
jgi:hypothetical protein